MTGTMAVVAAQNLSRSFVSETGQRVDAVRNIALQLEPGQLVHLTGPSGSGKTTLLALVGCMLRPSSGSLKVEGIETTELEPRARSAFRLRRIGFIFQSFRLVRWLSAEENIRLPLALSGSTDAGQRTLDLLDLVGLSERRAFFPHELSGGEQQRVAVARALAADPQVILADEPTGNLDSKTGIEILTLLRSAASQQGKTVIVASHSEAVRRLADKVFTMRDGQFQY